MLSGPPLPLPHDIPLQQLLSHARQPGMLGAWVRGSTRALHVYEVGRGVVHRLLVDPDLGHLLSRCDRIALREGTQPVVLDACAIIGWRVLQVVTATPYLPSLERLKEILPGAHLESSGFRVSVSSRLPEQVLAECLTYGIRVKESRIIYPAPIPTRPAVRDRAAPASSADIPPAHPLRSAPGAQPIAARCPTPFEVADSQ
jgi:hypothetical protein